MDLAIEARGLSKRYGRNWVLANVSFEVSRGSVLLVAGRNGSGKTTLFRVLTTAAKADGGSANVAGISLDDKEPLRRRVALLTHHGYAYESLTATENLRAFARMSNLDDSRLEKLVDEVGLGKAREKEVAAYSAGMRKRLSLARLLLQLPRAEVVFLDEPYAALDDEGLEFVDALIRRVQAAGKTVAVVSHLLERGVGIATQAVLLDGGRMVWSGSPRDLMSRRGALAEA